MSLKKIWPRIKNALKNRMVNWGDVPFGGHRRVAKHVKAYKHAASRYERLKGKREIREQVSDMEVPIE